MPHSDYAGLFALSPALSTLHAREIPLAVRLFADMEADTRGAVVLAFGYHQYRDLPISLNSGVYSYI